MPTHRDRANRYAEVRKAVKILEKIGVEVDSYTQDGEYFLRYKGYKCLVDIKPIPTNMIYEFVKDQGLAVIQSQKRGLLEKWEDTLDIG